MKKNYNEIKFGDVVYFKINGNKNRNYILNQFDYNSLSRDLEASANLLKTQENFSTQNLLSSNYNNFINKNKYLTNKKDQNIEDSLFLLLPYNYKKFIEIKSNIENKIDKLVLDYKSFSNLELIKKLNELYLFYLNLKEECTENKDINKLNYNYNCNVLQNNKVKFYDKILFLHMKTRMFLSIGKNDNSKLILYKKNEISTMNNIFSVVLTEMLNDNCIFYLMPINKFDKDTDTVYSNQSIIISKDLYCESNQIQKKLYISFVNTTNNKNTLKRINKNANISSFSQSVSPDNSSSYTTKKTNNLNNSNYSLSSNNLFISDEIKSNSKQSGNSKIDSNRKKPYTFSDSSKSSKDKDNADLLYKTNNLLIENYDIKNSLTRTNSISTKNVKIFGFEKIDNIQPIQILKHSSNIDFNNNYLSYNNYIWLSCNSILINKKVVNKNDYNALSNIKKTNKNIYDINYFSDSPNKRKTNSKLSRIIDNSLIKINNKKKNYSLNRDNKNQTCIEEEIIKDIFNSSSFLTYDVKEDDLEFNSNSFALFKIEASKNENLNNKTNIYQTNNLLSKFVSNNEDFYSPYIKYDQKVKIIHVVSRKYLTFITYEDLHEICFNTCHKHINYIQSKLDKDSSIINKTGILFLTSCLTSYSDWRLMRSYIIVDKDNYERNKSYGLTFSKKKLKYQNLIKTNTFNLNDRIYIKKDDIVRLFHNNSNMFLSFNIKINHLYTKLDNLEHLFNNNSNRYNKKIKNLTNNYELNSYIIKFSLTKNTYDKDLFTINSANEDTITELNLLVKNKSKFTELINILTNNKLIKNFTRYMLENLNNNNHTSSEVKIKTDREVNNNIVILENLNKIENNLLFNYNYKLYKNIAKTMVFVKRSYMKLNEIFNYYINYLNNNMYNLPDINSEFGIVINKRQKLAKDQFLLQDSVEFLQASFDIITKYNDILVIVYNKLNNIKYKKKLNATNNQNNTNMFVTNKLKTNYNVSNTNFKTRTFIKAISKTSNKKLLLRKNNLNINKKYTNNKLKYLFIIKENINEFLLEINKCVKNCLGFINECSKNNVENSSYILTNKNLLINYIKIYKENCEDIINLIRKDDANNDFQNIIDKKKQNKKSNSTNKLYDIGENTDYKQNLNSNNIKNRIFNNFDVSKNFNIKLCDIIFQYINNLNSYSAYPLELLDKLINANEDNFKLKEFILLNILDTYKNKYIIKIETNFENLNLSLIYKDINQTYVCRSLISLCNKETILDNNDSYDRNICNYIAAQLNLISKLCSKQNYFCIKKIREIFPLEYLIYHIAHITLEDNVLTGLINILNNCYIDCFPHYLNKSNNLKSTLIDIEDLKVISIENSIYVKSFIDPEYINLIICISLLYLQQMISPNINNILNKDVYNDNKFNNNNSDYDLSINKAYIANINLINNIINCNLYLKIIYDKSLYSRLFKKKDTKIDNLINKYTDNNLINLKKYINVNNNLLNSIDQNSVNISNNYKTNFTNEIKNKELKNKYVYKHRKNTASNQLLLSNKNEYTITNNNNYEINNITNNKNYYPEYSVNSNIVKNNLHDNQNINNTFVKQTKFIILEEAKTLQRNIEIENYNNSSKLKTNKNAKKNMFIDIYFLYFNNYNGPIGTIYLNIILKYFIYYIEEYFVLRNIDNYNNYKKMFIDVIKKSSNKDTIYQSKVNCLKYVSFNIKNLIETIFQNVDKQNYDKIQDYENINKSNIILNSNKNLNSISDDKKENQNKEIIKNSYTSDNINNSKKLIYNEFMNKITILFDNVINKSVDYATNFFIDHVLSSVHRFIKLNKNNKKLNFINIKDGLNLNNLIRYLNEESLDSCFLNIQNLDKNSINYKLSLKGSGVSKILNSLLYKSLETNLNYDLTYPILNIIRKINNKHNEIISNLKSTNLIYKLKDIRIYCLMKNYIHCLAELTEKRHKILSISNLHYTNKSNYNSLMLIILNISKMFYKDNNISKGINPDTIVNNNSFYLIQYISTSMSLDVYLINLLKEICDIYPRNEISLDEYNYNKDLNHLIKSILKLLRLNCFLNIGFQVRISSFIKSILQYKFLYNLGLITLIKTCLNTCLYNFDNIGIIDNSLLFESNSNYKDNSFNNNSRKYSNNASYDNTSVNSSRCFGLEKGRSSMHIKRSFNYKDSYSIILQDSCYDKTTQIEYNHLKSIKEIIITILNNEISEYKVDTILSNFTLDYELLKESKNKYNFSYFIKVKKIFNQYNVILKLINLLCLLLCKIEKDIDLKKNIFQFSFKLINSILNKHNLLNNLQSYYQFFNSTNTLKKNSNCNLNIKTNFLMTFLDENISIVTKNFLLIRFLVYSNAFKIINYLIATNKRESIKYINDYLSFEILRYWIQSPIISKNICFINNNIKLISDNKYDISSKELEFSFTNNLISSVFNHKRYVSYILLECYITQINKLKTFEIQVFFNSMDNDISSYFLLNNLINTQNNLKLVGNLKYYSYFYLILGIFPIVFKSINLISLNNFKSLHDYEHYVDQLKDIVKNFKKVFEIIVGDTNFFNNEIWNFEQFYDNKISIIIDIINNKNNNICNRNKSNKYINDYNNLDINTYKHKFEHSILDTVKEYFLNDNKKKINYLYRRSLLTFIVLSISNFIGLLGNINFSKMMKLFIYKELKQYRKKRINSKNDKTILLYEKEARKAINEFQYKIDFFFFYRTRLFINKIKNTKIKFSLSFENRLAKLNDSDSLIHNYVYNKKINNLNNSDNIFINTQKNLLNKNIKYKNNIIKIENTEANKLKVNKYEDYNKKHLINNKTNNENFNYFDKEFEEFKVIARYKKLFYDKLFDKEIRYFSKNNLNNNKTITSLMLKYYESLDFNNIKLHKNNLIIFDFDEEDNEIIDMTYEDEEACVLFLYDYLKYINTFSNIQEFICVENCNYSNYIKSTIDIIKTSDTLNNPHFLNNNNITNTLLEKNYSNLELFNESVSLFNVQTSNNIVENYHKFNYIISLFGKIINDSFIEIIKSNNKTFKLSKEYEIKNSFNYFNIINFILHIFNCLITLTSEFLKPNNLYCANSNTSKINININTYFRNIYIDSNYYYYHTNNVFNYFELNESSNLIFSSFNNILSKEITHLVKNQYINIQNMFNNSNIINILFDILCNIIYISNKRNLNVKLNLTSENNDLNNLIDQNIYNNKSQTKQNTNLDLSLKISDNIYLILNILNKLLVNNKSTQYNYYYLCRTHEKSVNFFMLLNKIIENDHNYIKFKIKKYFFNYSDTDIYNDKLNTNNMQIIFYHIRLLAVGHFFDMQNYLRDQTNNKLCFNFILILVNYINDIFTTLKEINDTEFVINFKRFGLNISKKNTLEYKSFLVNNVKFFNANKTRINNIDKICLILNHFSLLIFERLLYVFDVLTELLKGPCSNNQNYIINTKIIEVVDKILKEVSFNIDNYNKNISEKQYFKKFIRYFCKNKKVNKINQESKRFLDLLEEDIINKKYKEYDKIINLNSYSFNKLRIGLSKKYNKIHNQKKKLNVLNSLGKFAKLNSSKKKSLSKIKYNSILLFSNISDFKKSLLVYKIGMFLLSLIEGKKSVKDDVISKIIREFDINYLYSIIGELYLKLVNKAKLVGFKSFNNESNMEFFLYSKYEANNKFKTDISNSDKVVCEAAFNLYFFIKLISKIDKNGSINCVFKTLRNNDTIEAINLDTVLNRERKTEKSNNNSITLFKKAILYLENNSCEIEIVKDNKLILIIFPKIYIFKGRSKVLMTKFEESVNRSSNISKLKSIYKFYPSIYDSLKQLNKLQYYFNKHLVTNILFNYPKFYSRLSDLTCIVINILIFTSFSFEGINMNGNINNIKSIEDGVYYKRLKIIKIFGYINIRSKFCY